MRTNLSVLMLILSPAPTPIPPYVAAAVAEPSRPAAEVAVDGARKPAAVIAFAGVKPGDRIADFMSGNGYFTRIFSSVVGPSGRVYAFLPEEQLKNCSPDETAGTRAIEHDPRYTNVTVLTAAVHRFRPPEPLDEIWTALNFHDLYDSFMGPADVAAVTRSMFDALKPGGLLLVIDHVAHGVHAPRYRNPASHRSRSDPARGPPGWISSRIGKRSVAQPSGCA